MTIGKERKVLAERHKKRLEFWETLLARSKEQTLLHSNITPRIYNWIGTGAGKTGITYKYRITNKSGFIELYIDQGKDSKLNNKRVFDILLLKKEDIERQFGEALEWKRMDNSRCSVIRKSYPISRLYDQDKWEALQEEMINGMIKLEKALKKPLKDLLVVKINI